LLAIIEFYQMIPYLILCLAKKYSFNLNVTGTDLPLYKFEEQYEKNSLIIVKIVLREAPESLAWGRHVCFDSSPW